jgi:sialate O-acetylesterase
MNLKSLVFILLAAAAPCVRAEVRLPRLFSDHMVLQRDAPIHVWGWAEPGEAVSAAMNGATQTATADRLGHWSVYLPAMPAGGPFELKVAGKNTVQFTDILMGDVWFASGQSNMEIPLIGFPGSAVINHAEEEIAQANHPNIRLFLVKKKASDYPLNDFADEASWSVCSPETVRKFSAVAYFFGRNLAESEHVPIGLIDSTWGGTPAAAWVSLEGLASDPALMPEFADRARMVATQADIPAMLAAEKREDAAAKQANTPAPAHAWHPDPASWGPAALFNGMVAPAVPFGIKGAIWYQGESDTTVPLAPLYEKAFTGLIQDWRRQWRQGDFPFFFVQIANFKGGSTALWPVVREAQRRTLALKNTGMAVTIDVGDVTNVHPSDKQTVSARLSVAARAIAYGASVEYTGPAFRQTSVENGSIRVWFDHAGGLSAKAGEPQGFEIAGHDHNYLPASARIDGQAIVLSNPQIANPEYVRYGWANAPTLNLYNSAGLPMSPFTSEEGIPMPPER